MEKFNVDHQYKLFLQKAELIESEMSEDQRIETKIIFYAAFGQLLMLLRNDITVLPVNEGIKVLGDMVNQIKRFFND